MKWTIGHYHLHIIPVWTAILIRKDHALIQWLLCCNNPDGQLERRPEKLHRYVLIWNIQIQHLVDCSHGTVSARNATNGLRSSNVTMCASHEFSRVQWIRAAGSPNKCGDVCQPRVQWIRAAGSPNKCSDVCQPRVQWIHTADSPNKCGNVCHHVFSRWYVHRTCPTIVAMCASHEFSRVQWIRAAYSPNKCGNVCQPLAMYASHWRCVPATSSMDMCSGLAQQMWRCVQAKSLVELNGYVQRTRPTNVAICASPEFRRVQWIRAVVSLNNMQDRSDLPISDLLRSQWEDSDLGQLSPEIKNL